MRQTHVSLHWHGHHSHSRKIKTNLYCNRLVTSIQSIVTWEWFSIRDCLDQVILWACQWGVILMMLIELETHTHYDQHQYPQLFQLFKSKKREPSTSIHAFSLLTVSLWSCFRFLTLWFLDCNLKLWAKIILSPTKLLLSGYIVPATADNTWKCLHFISLND